jgi:hypothetical protein
MEETPAVKRDRRAYYREYQRKRYAESRANVPAKKSPSENNTANFYTREEKACFFKAKLERVAANAKQRQKDFNLKLKDLQLPDKCPVLGITLDYGWPVTNIEAVPSIDRVNNNLGYVPGNVIVISNRANKLKSDATKEEILKAAQFWQGFFSGEREALAALGEPAPGCVAAVVRSERHEAKKAYWREYQRKRVAAKKLGRP